MVTWCTMDSCRSQKQQQQELLLLLLQQRQWRQHIVLGTGMNGEPRKSMNLFGMPIKIQLVSATWAACLRQKIPRFLSFSLLLHNSPIKTKFFFVLFSFSIDKGWTEVSLSLILSLGLLVHLQAARRLCRKSRVSLMQKIAKMTEKCITLCALGPPPNSALYLMLQEVAKWALLLLISVQSN